MLLVLVVVAAGAAIAAAFLNSASVRVLTSGNAVDYAKAEYLAESGLSEAAYFLQKPDPTQSEGFWPGVAERHIDGSANYYQVSVNKDDNDATLLHAVSTAHLVGAAGEILAFSLERRFPKPGPVFTHDLMADHDLFIPANLTLNGNSYAAGNMTNEGTINGDAEATGSIVNGGTITGEILPNSASIYIPACPLEYPVTYTYQGTQYQTTTITSGTLQGISWTSAPADNPMGVYIRYGDLEFEGGNTIVGTLIVTGQLTITVQNSESSITANPGFPAIVAQNNMILQQGGSTLTINGASIIHGAIQANNPKSPIVTNGPLVFLNAEGGFASSLAGISFTINHDESRMDVSGLFP